MAHLINQRFIPKLVISVCGVMMVGCSLFNNDSPDIPVSQVSPSTETAAQASPEASPNIAPETSTRPSNVPTTTTPANPQPTSTDVAAVPSPKVQLTEAPKTHLPKEDKQLVSQIAKETEKKSKIARQDSGKTYLDNILRLQQAERFVGGAFRPSLSALADDIPDETDEYQFKILTADTEQAVVVAIAKIPGLNSYVGAAYNIDGGTPISGICKSNLPTQKAPNSPKLAGKSVQCASGSTAIE